MKRFLTVALAVAMVGPTFASDFSQLAEPSFGRFLMMDAKQLRHVECAGLALYHAERGEAPGDEAARKLADEVIRRSAIAIGDEGFARKIVEGKASSYADPTKSDAFWTEVRQEMTMKCEPLFAASRKGTAELTAALGPAPTEPLQLPSPEQCLATVRYSKEIGAGDYTADLDETLQAARIDGVNPSEREAREKVVVAGINALRAAKPDVHMVENMVVACFPTIAEVVKSLEPPGGKPRRNRQ